MIVLPSVARACDDQSTVHRDWQLGGYQFCSRGTCAVFGGLTEFCFVFRFGFRASFARFLVANQAVILFLLPRRCVKSFSAILQRIRSRTSIDIIDMCVCVTVFTTHMFTWPISYSRSTAQLLDLSRVVHWCVTHCRHVVYSELWPVISQWVISL